ncbi:MAG: histidine phosphatase family protein [Acidimicrobiales bacterium]|nr:histidine phosphatase family protein [Acidimicrobiales bacterium]MDP6288353.1 histidine phosphatase family protein [Acidimicrobiales bacterium]MDP6910730.1 histidine phosphatase family protein [Acidimicrobiales bacterium]
MELLVIRHALPEAEVRSDGPADPPLSALGIQQAEATAEFLADETVDAIVTSTMRRAIQTGQPLADRLGLTLKRLDGLKESDHRRSSYTPAEDMDADHEVIREFMEDPHRMFSDGYEPFRDRVQKTFDEIVATQRGRTVAVFCHSMVASVYIQTLLGHDDPFALISDYCGISRISASSTGVRTLRSVNETAHLRHLV